MIKLAFNHTHMNISFRFGFVYRKNEIPIANTLLAPRLFDITVDIRVHGNCYVIKMHPISDQVSIKTNRYRLGDRSICC